MNKHYDEAESDLRIGMNDAAQVHATLALAYEQRTANLLAFFATEDIADTSTHCIDYRAVADQIEERLGLA